MRSAIQKAKRRQDGERPLDSTRRPVAETTVALAPMVAEAVDSRTQDPREDASGVDNLDSNETRPRMIEVEIVRNARSRTARAVAPQSMTPAPQSMTPAPIHPPVVVASSPGGEPIKIRTLEEVRDRHRNAARRHGDVFGFGSEVLEGYMLRGSVAGHPLTEESVRPAAIKCLTLAFDEALKHPRGRWAGRSVTQLREYAWLLGLHQVVAFADDERNFARYGVPVLRRAAEALGVQPPIRIMAWAPGKPCTKGCGLCGP